MEKDTFFDVPTKIIALSNREIELPILYYDVSNLNLLFATQYEFVSDILQPYGFQPGLKWGNKAVVVLAFYNYRETSLGSYNEVGLAIPVLLKDDPAPINSWLDLYSKLETRKTGFYILNLPVTTDIALAAGCEVWGYPKFITQIPIKFEGNSFEGEVIDPDDRKQILKVGGALGIAMPMLPMSLITYSFLNQNMLRTQVDVRGRVRLGSKGSFRLSIGESKHSMAQNLRDLALDDAQPIFVLSTHHFQSRLNQGIELPLPIHQN